MNDASFAPRSGTLRIDNADAWLRVDALASDLLRIRLAPLGARPEDASWVVPATWRNARDPAAVVQTTPDGATLRTATLVARVARESLALRIEDKAGRVLLDDAPGGGFAFDGAGFTLRKTLAAGEHVVALGDKTGPLDRRGRRFVNWCTDHDVLPEADPLYKAIPFLIGAGGPAGCWGLFLDNSWRLEMDIGAGASDVLAISAAGGPLDCYVIAGANIGDVVRRYADLSGHPPLPPRWAFGYQQCRWSYRTADELREIAARLRRDRVPADVLWLDIDFQDRKRPFTTDEQTFPDLPGLVAELKRDGFATIVITDLHIAAAPAQGYAPYDSGIAADVFLKNADGTIYEGAVWPGPCHFPDFTRGAVRAWWGGLFADFVKAGVAGFWNDMNEPAVFLVPGKTIPQDVVGRVEEPGFAPRAITQAEAHNLVGMLNSRATFEGLQRLTPDTRPFVMTRATFAGGQRYAVTWTGDNVSTWDQIDLGVRQTLNLGLSGFAYTAVDLGGFNGTPTADLLTRWFQVQAFMPLMRDHASDTSPPQEPWVHGPAHLAIRRRFVEERYRLMPTLYALAEEAHRTGAPMIRPCFYEDAALLDAPADAATAFLLGAHLLVAVPPPVDARRGFDVVLPQGDWFDWWSDAPVAAREREGLHGVHRVAAEPICALDRLPVYVRAGAIIARQALVQSLSQVPEGLLELHVWPGADGATTLYDDDGLTLAHTRGVFRRQRVRTAPHEGGLTLAFEAPEGNHVPWWTQIAVIVHLWPEKTARAAADDRTIEAEIDEPRRLATFVIDAPTEAQRFRIAASSP